MSTSIEAKNTETKNRTSDLLDAFKSKLDQMDHIERDLFERYCKKAQISGFTDEEIIKNYIKSLKPTAQEKTTEQKQRLERTNAQRIAGYATTALLAPVNALAGLSNITGLTKRFHNLMGPTPHDESFDDVMRGGIASLLGTDADHLRPQSRLGKNIDRSSEFLGLAAPTAGIFGHLPNSAKGIAAFTGEEVGRGVVDSELEQAGYGPLARIGTQLLGSFVRPGVNYAKNLQRDGYSNRFAQFSARLNKAKIQEPVVEALERRKIEHFPPSVVTDNPNIVKKQQAALNETKSLKVQQVFQNLNRDLDYAFQTAANEISPVISNSPSFAKNTKLITKEAEKLKKTQRSDLLTRKSILVDKMNDIGPLRGPMTHDVNLDKLMQDFHNTYKITDKEAGRTASTIEDVRKSMFTTANPEIEARAAAELAGKLEKPNLVTAHKNTLGYRKTIQHLGNQTKNTLVDARNRSWKEVQKNYDGLNFQLRRMGTLDPTSWVKKAQATYKELRNAKHLTRDQAVAAEKLKSMWKKMAFRDEEGKLLGYRISLESFNQTMKNLGKDIDFETLETGHTGLHHIWEYGQDILKDALKQNSGLAENLDFAREQARIHYSKFRNNKHVRNFLNTQNTSDFLRKTTTKGEHYDSVLNAVREHPGFEDLSSSLERHILDEAFPSNHPTVRNDSELATLSKKVQGQLDANEMFSKLSKTSRAALEGITNEIESSLSANAAKPKLGNVSKQISKGFATPEELLTGYESLLIKEEAIAKVGYHGSRDPIGDYKEILNQMEKVADKRFGKKVAIEMKNIRAQFYENAASQKVLQFAADGDISSLTGMMKEEEGLAAIEKVFDKLPDGQKKLAVLKRKVFEEYLNLPANRHGVDAKEIARLKKLDGKEETYWRMLLGNKAYESFRDVQLISESFTKNTMPYTNVSRSGHVSNEMIKRLRALQQIFKGKFVNATIGFIGPDYLNKVVVDPAFVKEMIKVGRAKSSKEIQSGLEAMTVIYNRAKSASKEVALRTAQTQSKNETKK